MADKTGIPDEYERAVRLLKEKVNTPEVLTALGKEITGAASIDVAEALVGLEWGNILSKRSPEPFHKAVDDFLVRHAPDEYSAYKAAKAALEDKGVARDRKFTDHVGRYVGGKEGQGRSPGT